MGLIPRSSAAVSVSPSKARLGQIPHSTAARYLFAREYNNFLLFYMMISPSKGYFSKEWYNIL